MWNDWHEQRAASTRSLSSWAAEAGVPVAVLSIANGVEADSSIASSSRLLLPGRESDPPPRTAAATAKTWVENPAAIEAHLRTADVTSIEDIGTGVTHPRRAHLHPDQPVESLVWKVLPPGRRGGFWESYKSEIAAYALDTLLGMHMVPPVVERQIGSDTGAAVMWIGSIKSVKELGGNVPSGPAWGKALRMMLMFDNLIANPDRNAGNILIGQPGEFVLIDHSRAFVTSTKLPQKVERVDAELWDSMKALTRDDLVRTLKPWLDDDAIGAIVQRRDRIKQQTLRHAEWRSDRRRRSRDELSPRRHRRHR